MAPLTTAPRGTKDILPAEISRWQYLERTLLTTAELFGFKEIRLPTFEHTELFCRSVGETTDVVGKEMYTFTDKGNRSITLRPEVTAGA
ncbi:MAG: ATP phosphoribosyltransferase regulatory subunit, partial [Angelakisella sp.]